MIKRIINFFKRNKQEESAKPAIEVNLGDNDILVIHTEKQLSKQHCDLIKDSFDNFLNSGSKCLVLPDGMTYSVIHRAP